eukprot:gnl/TRDRNA2_/TRDRNA2_32051_c0_seq1.p1 gnl/TRDRNA2_/TRDRNA2_32051_c0~~gnl/TRDRNA2_/TRDRNA2_32051_c0_seq1.p1  ORF type:complete len:334 (-),score=54.26 gnl/TRDRNA2_/TRDRNA2_32051_c0_seq1:276-1277(-)
MTDQCDSLGEPLLQELTAQRACCSRPCLIVLSLFVALSCEVLHNSGQSVVQEPLATMGWQKMQAPRVWHSMQPARALQHTNVQQHTNMQTATVWPDTWPAGAVEPPRTSFHILAAADTSNTSAGSAWLSMQKAWASADLRGVGSGSKDAFLLPWLDTLLSTRYSLVEKGTAFGPFRGLVKADDPELELALDEIMLVIDSVKDNALAQVRLPIALPSLRIKLGALRRVLALMTEDSSDPVQLKRALVIVLRELSRSKGGIRALEKQVMADPRALDTERTPDGRIRESTKSSSAVPKQALWSGFGGSNVKTMNDGSTVETLPDGSTRYKFAEEQI